MANTLSFDDLVPKKKKLLTQEQVQALTKDNPLQQPKADFVGISKGADGADAIEDPAVAFNGIAGNPDIAQAPEAALSFDDLVPKAAGARVSPSAESAISPIGGDWENFAAGIGAKLADIPLGLKQRWHELENYTSRGLPGSEIDAQNLSTTNQEVADKRARDAPLMATKAGKGGAFVGAAIPAAGAAMLPGGQGLAASMLAGGGLGAIEPAVDGESVVKNTLFGLGGGGAGYGAGKLIGAAGSKISGALGKSKSVNALKDAVLGQSKNMGYVIPPTQANSAGVRGSVNKTLESLAGKLSTAQKASVKNQPISNQAIAKDLGLPPDQPISIEVLKTVRSAAGEVYEEVKQLGTIVTDEKYFAGLDNLAASTRNAEKSFPGLGDTKLEDIVKSLKQPKFDAGDAIDALKTLRGKADDFYAQGNKTLGGAYRKATGVLEDMIERAAEKQRGSPALLENFRKARTTIAKTYSVEKALNDSTGNVSARKLAAQLAKGKPLSGEIKKVAQFGQAYPKAAEEIQSSIPGSSPLDWAMGAGASVGTGNIAGMGMLAARPGARSLVLSSPYQKLMTTPSYESMLAKALQNRITQQGLRIGTIAGLPQLTKE